ncbi:hypothetical protein [Pseudoflavonifractor phocaeensis]|uniref:hypothetical protein n=1 Tax=Pseudoflavonifractor phocaeensis TaxID=1870988 RepID=UPI00210B911F|nr:hypothetical protein [Pseudoflavonifractor phocaeensis]MCQ4863539.1 hypothetical protein [Pseudoflavonifractor phocaeensis]
MNRREKKALRERSSTRQLMGIDRIADYGLKTGHGDLVFFLLRPANLSVLSEAGVTARVNALMNVLKGMDELELLALDSRESFQRNKDWYQARREAEALPAVRELLAQDGAHLDEIQIATASAREFALAVRLREREAAEPLLYLARLEKSIRDQGFQVRRAAARDLKRLLAVYYEQNITTEQFEDFDGERWMDGE